MNFFDHVKIYVKAGDGGNGAIAFHREKYISHGGPSGGDGGNGGDIVFRVDRDANTLLAYRFKHRFVAQNGGDGSGEKFHGANAPDLVLSVPAGTLIKDAATGKIIHDMSENDGADYTCCRGGRGGWGNKHFATPTRQAPQFAKNGTKGEERELALELKLIADVGLIGYPSVGKSSLLACISAARPKIADYHFTTLSPNLGVVQVDGGQGFVVADIPGLIDGAAEGAGLGHDFLRHIERTRMLVHVVDISGSEGRDPYEDFKKINAELKEYSEKLAALPQIVALNKCDIPGAEENRKAFVKKCRKYKKYPITAVTGEGTRELIEGIFAVLDTLPPPQPIPADDFEYERADVNEFRIDKDEQENVWYVTGGLVDMLERNVVLSDPDSMAYFQKVLKDKGVISALRAAGVQEDDTVVIGGVEFSFKE